MIETERCNIRSFCKEDASALFRILSNPSVMKYIEEPFTMEQTQQFIEEAGLCEQPLVYALELKENHLLIGHVIYHSYEEDAYEIGWIIDEKYWGQGIADEITKSLILHAKKTGIKSLIIECDPKQSTTKHIAEKNNFERISEEPLMVYMLQL
ncbi:GNAT family N-acetyltransferase [Anaerosporobacter faecicola]|uniref:GNAT family N-acetyltransferase n=1 Tax=Anaerosporobacter faecicola TaxID=2718714 RepID=UPI00143B88B5|nr:GNAT family N-acetyltransferase [Anaerosporobacter faecicola]